jgi:hypothetical protein
VPGTIGAFIGTAVQKRVQQSSIATSGRRAYALTKGSTQNHGNKIVAKEEKILQTMSASEGLSRRDAVRQVKEQIKKEKEEKRKNRSSTLSESPSWAQQELSAENQQLHKESEEKS